ncbi:MAG: AMP-binding protein, partial [bacterium]
MIAVPDPVASARLAAPDGLAIDAPDGRCTWRALDARVDDGAAWLAAQGVGPGATVAVSGAPGLGCIAWLLATARVGAAVLPLSPDPPARAAAIAAGRPALVVDAASTPPAAAAPRPERFWPLDERRLRVATS